MPFAVWARGEKGNGNSQNINVEKLNKQPTTLLTFSADTNNDGIDDGDLKLNFTPDGSVDPNTVIYLDTDGDGIADSAPQTFTMEIGGTLPNKAKLNGVGPNNENLGGEEIVVLTLEDGTRLFFLRDFIFDPADTAASDDNFDLMEDFPSGGYSLVTPFVCYVAGTKIETTAGTKPVEELKVGDLISTESGASKPILYIASQSLPKSSIRAFPKLRPVLIPKNTLEALQPSQDLLVSPQHRILIRDPEIQLLFGMDAAFVAARELPFARLAPVKATTYVHILCDTHTVVHANGCESETLFPGDVAMISMSPNARSEIKAILGNSINQKTAYPCLTAQEAAVWRDAVQRREKRTA